MRWRYLPAWPVLWRHLTRSCHYKILALHCFSRLSPELVPSARYLRGNLRPVNLFRIVSLIPYFPQRIP